MILTRPLIFEKKKKRKGCGISPNLTKMTRFDKKQNKTKPRELIFFFISQLFKQVIGFTVLFFPIFSCNPKGVVYSPY